MSLNFQKIFNLLKEMFLICRYSRITVSAKLSVLMSHVQTSLVYKNCLFNVTIL